MNFLRLVRFLPRVCFTVAMTSSMQVFVAAATAAAASSSSRPGDEILRRQFQMETDRLAAGGLSEVRTLEAWQARRGEWRRQLAEMLGLWPMPARTELKAAVTGRTTHAGFNVENVHFQSSPGLYVTANLYLPADGNGPFPTILYLSGHGPVISNGVSYGNKVSYQHHGAWFARNGHACLIVDSLQLGEILGLHHGTYRENLWWWNARGYSPAGVEAWNCIRALDYLSTRPEVDPNRFGVTGRSGGGAYSWWVAALDDRIKAAAPVAGITDLRNHVVDGTVEGHCDCMFMVNTYRWDYPLVAALVAPRPLLIVNTDADSIFPLDGVQRLHARVRDIYRLHGAANDLGLVIAPGPHKDTQDLQVPTFRWFNRHLRGIDPIIEMAAVPLCTPEQLRVFQSLPTDAINTNIHDVFVPAAAPASVAPGRRDWEAQRDRWMQGLREKCFAGWPATKSAPALTRLWTAKRGGLRLECFEFPSEEGLALRVYALHGVSSRRARELKLTVLDDSAGVASTVSGGPPPGSVQSKLSFERWLAAMAVEFRAELTTELGAAGREIAADPSGWNDLRASAGPDAALAWLAPRGVGVTAWTDTPKNQVQIRRRFMLLGQTLDSMRVWDIRRAVQALRASDDWRSTRVTLAGTGAMACNVLYASLFEADATRLELTALPASHRIGPDYLNVLKELDVPQALAIAAERGAVVLRRSDQAVAAYARETIRQLGWNRERLKVE